MTTIHAGDPVTVVSGRHETIISASTFSYILDKAREAALQNFSTHGSERILHREIKSRTVRMAIAAGNGTGQGEHTE